MYIYIYIYIYIRFFFSTNKIMNKIHIIGKKECLVVVLVICYIKLCLFCGIGGIICNAFVTSCFILSVFQTVVSLLIKLCTVVILKPIYIC